MAAPNFLDKFKLDIDKSLLSASRMKPGELSSKGMGKKVFADSKTFTFEKVKSAPIKNPVLVVDDAQIPSVVQYQEEMVKDDAVESEDFSLPTSLLHKVEPPNSDDVETIEPTAFDGAEFSSMDKSQNQDPPMLIKEEFALEVFEVEPIEEDKAKEQIITPNNEEVEKKAGHELVQLNDYHGFSIENAQKEMGQLRKDLAQLDPNLKVPVWPPIQELANPNQKKLNSIIIKGQKVLIFKMMCYSIANKLALNIEALEKENYPYQTKKEAKKKVMITAAHLQKIGIDLNTSPSWDSDDDEEHDLDMEDIARLNARNFEYGISSSDFSFINPIGSKINQQRIDNEAREREKKMSKYKKTLDIYSDDEASVYQKAIAQFLSENQEILDNIIEDEPVKGKKNIDNPKSINLDDDDDYLDDIDD